MGFWDKVKKGAEIAKKGAELTDEAVKRQVSRMSDSELKSASIQKPNNKYYREELEKRGLA